MAKAKDMEKNKTITKTKKVKRKNSTSPGVKIPSKKNRQTAVREYVVPLSLHEQCSSSSDDSDEEDGDSHSICVTQKIKHRMCDIR